MQKQEIENLKQQAERAEREGNYGKVAEIRYGKIKEQEELITTITKQIEESGEKSLLKEEVDAEDIAESIAKTTGIPVTKMLQSDKEKLLKLEDHLHERVVGQDEAITAVADAIQKKPCRIAGSKETDRFIYLSWHNRGW